MVKLPADNFQRELQRNFANKMPRCFCIEVKIQLRGKTKRFCLILLFSESIKGVESLWLVGDNFLAETYRPHFKLKNDPQFYMKEFFEVIPYCSSRHNDKNQNIVSRLQITMAKALNDNTYLPNTIVVPLDNDIIDYLQYSKDFGLSMILGEIVEWLVQSFESLLESKAQMLPRRALKDQPTSIYWVAIPSHVNFDYEQRNMRNKFNLCLESVVRQHKHMRVIKLKNCWDHSDSNMVINNHITTWGLDIYWWAIDSAVKFNIAKRSEFFAREALKHTQKSKKQTAKQEMIMVGRKEHNLMVQNMFNRRRDQDDTNWPRESIEKNKKSNKKQAQQGPRFLLPPYKKS